MGLFSNKRKTAKAAPSGWVTVTALVDECDVLEFGNADSVGAEGQMVSGDPVHRYAYTYVFPDEKGKLVTIRKEEKLSESKGPKKGKRLTLAYDPSKPGDLVLLENEDDRNMRVLGAVKRNSKKGVTARAKVVGAKETGRVARPERTSYMREDPPPEIEKRLELKVSPPSGDEFETTILYWENQGVDKGLEGIYIYDPDDPDGGYPHFPTPEERKAKDPVAAARKNFQKALSKTKIPRKYR